jgi:hypothetical protein
MHRRRSADEEDQKREAKKKTEEEMLVFLRLHPLFFSEEEKFCERKSNLNGLNDARVVSFVWIEL